MTCGREPRTKGIIVVVIELIITESVRSLWVRVHLLDVSTCVLPLRLYLKVYVFDKSSDDTVLSYET
jgi:hypothetical protein